MRASDAANEPRWLAVLGRATDIAVIFCGALLCLLVFGNVLSRFVFAFDIAWSNELAIFAMVWATFLGGATAQRRRDHMRIGELVETLGGRPRLVAEVSVNAIVLVVLGLLVWYGVVIARKNMAQEMTVLYWPVGLIYAAMPVGSLLTAVHVVADTILLLRRGPGPAGPAATAG